MKTLEYLRHIFHSLNVILHSSKKTLLLLTIVAITFVLVANTVTLLSSKTSNTTLPSFGTVKTINVKAYWDPNCENMTEKIYCGAILPGKSKNVTLYIRNISNIKSRLLLDTLNLNPVSISDYLTLSWDYYGKSLNPDEVIRVTLFLYASNQDSFIRYLIANDVTDFNIGIQITAYEI